MYKSIKGIILKTKEDIIVHQVNCLGAMGAGLALHIKRKYPLSFKKYHDACVAHRPEALLGKTQMLKMEDGKIICNMFSQLKYGKGAKHTDYEAMTICFDKIYRYAKLNGLTVAIPYNIGCGLGGGNWPIVLNIISKRFKDRSIVKIYKL